MGALYLQPLNERMERLGVFYARFMDDWVVLASTRWKLRAAIREVNEVMAGCKVKQLGDERLEPPPALSKEEGNPAAARH